MIFKVKETVARDVDITFPMYRKTDGWGEYDKTPHWVRLDMPNYDTVRRTVVICREGVRPYWHVEMNPFSIVLSTDINDGHEDPPYGGFEWEPCTAEEFQQALDKALVFIDGLR